MRRIQSILGLLGIIGPIAWITLIVLLAGGWGRPGTPEYGRYEAHSQLWVFAFALMVCGFLGLFLRYRRGASVLAVIATASIIIGFATMMAGNVAEFRFFSDQPYQEGNARMWAWIAFLIGLLIVLSGVLLLGVDSWRRGVLASWARWVFVLALPATIAVAATEAPLTGLP